MSSNGGFPPLKLIKDDNKPSKIIKERAYSSSTKNVDIRHILSESIVKPMIELNKNEVNIIDSL